MQHMYIHIHICFIINTHIYYYCLVIYVLLYKYSKGNKNDVTLAFVSKNLFKPNFITDK